MSVHACVCVCVCVCVCSTLPSCGCRFYKPVTDLKKPPGLLCTLTPLGSRICCRGAVAEGAFWSDTSCQELFCSKPAWLPPSHHVWVDARPHTRVRELGSQGPPVPAPWLGFPFAHLFSFTGKMATSGHCVYMLKYDAAVFQPDLEMSL